MKNYIAVTLAVIVFAGASAAARADSITLEPSKDNTLFEDAAGALSNGAGDHIFAGRTLQGSGIDIRRALLAFDVSGNLPPNATILNATLRLSVTMEIAGDVDVALHRLTVDWGEGTSDANGQEGAGAPSTTGDATWLHTFFPGTFWTTPGGDFNATASATATVGAQGADYTWSSAQLAADVDDMLQSPGTNFGWMVIADESTAPTAKRFDSKDIQFISRRPKLMIDFTIPAPAPAQGPLAGILLFAGLGIAGFYIVLRRRAGA